jgi:hypothetical protein
MDKTGRFWLTIVATLALALVTVFSLPPQRRRAEEPSLGIRVIGAAVGVAVVGVVWAICFRVQLELGRISLFGIIMLITMEAVFFWAAQFLGRFPRL